MRFLGQTVIQDDDRLLTVLRNIEANPLRVKLVERAGDYPWSSFACHGLGHGDPLLDPVVGYEALAGNPGARQRRWSAYVHRTPEEEEELAAIRRSRRNGPALRRERMGGSSLSAIETRLDHPSSWPTALGTSSDPISSL